MLICSFARISEKRARSKGELKDQAPPAKQEEVSAFVSSKRIEWQSDTHAPTSLFLFFSSLLSLSLSLFGGDSVWHHAAQEAQARGLYHFQAVRSRLVLLGKSSTGKRKEHREKEEVMTSQVLKILALICCDKAVLKEEKNWVNFLFQLLSFVCAKPWDEYL